MCRLQFRRANIIDLEEIKHLSRQTFLDAYSTDTNDSDMNKYLSDAFTDERLTAELLDNNCIFFIVKQKEDSIGYIKLRWDNPLNELKTLPAIELQRFYLLASYYNKGLGKEMLDFSINYALQRHYQTIWLLVWYGNTKAIRFYSKADFAIFALKEFQYGYKLEVDYLMKKQL